MQIRVAQLYDGTITGLSGHFLGIYPMDVTHFEVSFIDPRVRSYLPVHLIKCIWRIKLIQ